METWSFHLNWRNSSTANWYSRIHLQIDISVSNCGTNIYLYHSMPESLDTGVIIWFSAEDCRPHVRMHVNRPHVSEHHKSEYKKTYWHDWKQSRRLLFFFFSFFFRQGIKNALCTLFSHKMDSVQILTSVICRLSALEVCKTQVYKSN